MKKIILLASVTVVFSLTSCKKNYTCACTGNPGTNSNNVYTFTIRDTKSKATTTCKAFVPAYNECHIQ